MLNEVKAFDAVGRTVWLRALSCTDLAMKLYLFAYFLPKGLEHLKNVGMPSR